MSSTERTTIGLSISAHSKLDLLVDRGHFKRGRDAYRFAIAFALVKKINPPKVQHAKTKYNIGTLDPDQYLKQAIEILMENQVVEISIYEMVERLAEWGINELASRVEKRGTLDFVDLFDQISKEN